jgi:hypothetical protein
MLGRLHKQQLPNSQEQIQILKPDKPLVPPVEPESVSLQGRSQLILHFEPVL